MYTSLLWRFEDFIRSTFRAASEGTLKVYKVARDENIFSPCCKSTSSLLSIDRINFHRREKRGGNCSEVELFEAKVFLNLTSDFERNKLNNVSKRTSAVV